MSKEISGEPVRRVHHSVHGPIGWLRLDNQTRLNAMSLSMWRELLVGVTDLTENPEVRVIVIAGTGGKAFCSGGDISEFDDQRYGANAMANYDEVGRAGINRLAEIGKPTIAMIEGYCLGGGMALALRCDLRISSDTAQFGIPAAKRGLSYDFPSIKLLTDLVGPSQAKHILYTGEKYGAREALGWGLVNEIVPAAEIERRVTDLANLIAANAPLSIQASKLIVDMTTKDPADQDLAACEAAEKQCLSSQDYAEATRAFLEKRTPMFIGR